MIHFVQYILAQQVLSDQTTPKITKVTDEIIVKFLFRGPLCHIEGQETFGLLLML